MKLFTALKETFPPRGTPGCCTLRAYVVGMLELGVPRSAYRRGGAVWRTVMESEDTVLSLTRPLTTSRRTQVYRAPEFEQRLPGSQEVDIGDVIRLEVRIRGIPQPEVRWYKNNRDITEDNRYQISNDGFVYRLKLEKVTREDEGTYKVKARNKEGDSASITYIEVICKKQRKKFNHARSVSVPAGFPEIAEAVQEEDDEERALEDIAPSPLSKRLRSSRGSLRKDHTWPRVVSNKTLPSDCIAYVEEDEQLADEAASTEEGESDLDLPTSDLDRPSLVSSSSFDSTSSSDHVEKAEVEEPEVRVKDKLGGASEDDLFELEMRHVLERQFQAVATSENQRQDATRRTNSEPDLTSETEEISAAKEVWRELTRLDRMEQAERYDPRQGEFSQENLVRFCDSLFLGVDADSLARFYALAIPAMTCFGLWMKLGPVKFCLCVLILCAMRHTGTIYKTFSR